MHQGNRVSKLLLFIDERYKITIINFKIKDVAIKSFIFTSYSDTSSEAPTLSRHTIPT